MKRGPRKTTRLKLSSTDYVDVYGALLAATRAARVAEDNRRGTRIAVECEVLVVLVRDGVPGEAFTALARDVSYNGIGLLTRHRPPRQARLIAQLPRDPQPPLC